MQVQRGRLRWCLFSVYPLSSLPSCKYREGKFRIVAVMMVDTWQVVSILCLSTDIIVPPSCKYKEGRLRDPIVAVMMVDTWQVVSILCLSTDITVYDHTSQALLLCDHTSQALLLCTFINQRLEVT